MISVVIPTYNAAKHLPALLQKLSQQTVDLELIVIDSGSLDDTPKILKESGINFYAISKEEFNHGGTRNLGVQLASHENIVMLTQDALPATKDAIAKLVHMMNSQECIGMAYGRQLPYPDATPMSIYARLTNYPSHSDIRTQHDIDRLGIRTCHCSNSFAAYKKSILLSVGGFPVNTVLGEDVVVAARLILAGRPLAYSSEAQVYHSHNYALIEEFKRYFDIGAFHQQQYNLLQRFLKTESEGIRYVLDEWRYLAENKAMSTLPSQVVRTGAKYLGYRLGRMNDSLSVGVKRRLSMHSGFWK